MPQTPNNPLTEKRHYTEELQKTLDEKISKLEQEERAVDKKLQSVSQTATELDEMGRELQNMAAAQAKQLQALATQEIAIRQLTKHFSGKLGELEDIENNLGSLLLFLSKKSERLEQDSKSMPSILPPSP